MTTQDVRTAGDVVDFAGVDIAWDARVLEPRAWTADQGRWAADLARTAPDGPILELCCGAGQIGLLAARLSGRTLVQVDRNPVATAFASNNAAAAGVESQTRCADLDVAVERDETFPLVIADPPWLHSDQVDRFPDDPVGAVDGGPDGMVLVEECLDVGLTHLAPGGSMVLQVGTREQVRAVRNHVGRHHRDHEITGIRDHSPRGLVVTLGGKR